MELNNEVLACLFGIVNGNLKILLIKKAEEPYKNLWILPKALIGETDLETSVKTLINDQIGFEDIYLEQVHTFSALDRYPDEHMIATAYLGLIDSVTIDYKRKERPNVETMWFDIDDLPKLGYDHDMVIATALERLKEKAKDLKTLKILYPTDFTLPELKRFYETLLGITIDRRNFRKKFINLALVTDTGYKNDGVNGRPAKLYRFNDTEEERKLF